MMRTRQSPARTALLIGTVLCAMLLIGMVSASSRLAYANIETSNSSIIVTTTDDELNSDGDCSLREAIQAANTGAAVDACLAGSGDDMIELPHGSYTLTLVGGSEENNSTGDLDIVGTVTISVATGAQPTIDGNQLDRVLHVHTGAVVSMSGVRLANGHAPDGSESGCGTTGDEPCQGAAGGGVLNQGTLTLRDCILSDNESGGGTDTICAVGGSGGAIDNQGTLRLERVTIRGNRTGHGGSDWGLCPGFGDGGDGGGLANSGTLEMIDSVVELNATGSGSFHGVGPEPPQGAGGDGGGILNSGLMTIQGSHVRQNETLGAASGHGGGIANSGTLTMTESSITNNLTGDGQRGLTTHGSGFRAGHGGGVYNSGVLDVHSSTINANATGDGGDGSAGGASGGDGGGVFNEGALTLHNSTISGNSTGDGGEAWFYGSAGSGGDGGGVANTGSVDLDHSTVSQNHTGQGDSHGQGGGIDGSSGPVRIKNTVVADNRSGAPSRDCHGVLDSYGYALIGTTAGCTITMNGSGDLLDLPAHLAPLADYGGPTLTHALFAQSMAIDAGSCTDIGMDSVMVDQRGEIRPQRLACDIGAYEAGVDPFTYLFLPQVVKQ